MEDSNLLNEQFGAIRRGIELGRTLQKEHPEIADIYGYYSQRDIPKMLEIQSEYGVGDNVAVNGVRYAIIGHEEGFGIESYVGLMDKEEREWIGREHNVQNGQTAYEQGLGVHAQTLEEKKEIGLIGGQTTYEQGVGVHGRTAEQHSEDGRNGVIATGKTLWTDEEKEFAYRLSQEQEYQRGSLVNNELIALELNIQYHDCKEVRSTPAVANQLYRHGKSLVDMVI